MVAPLSSFASKGRLFPSDPDDNSGSTPYLESLIQRSPAGYDPITVGGGFNGTDALNNPQLGGYLQQNGWMDPDTGAWYGKSGTQQSLVDEIDSHRSSKGTDFLTYMPLLFGGALGAAAFAGAGTMGAGQAMSGVASGAGGTLAGEAGFLPGSFELGASSFGGTAAAGLDAASAAAAAGGSGGGFLEQLQRLLKLPGLPGSGSNDYGTVKTLADIASGVYGLSQSGKMGNLAQPGQDAAQRMQMLMQNPNAITQMPGYQQLLKSRETALARRMAAQGYNMSGNERASLAELGGAQYAEFYGNEMDRLSRMVQGAVAPSVAEQQMRANSINRLIYGVSRFVG